MKQRLKYGLITLFFILLNSSFIRVQSAILNNVSFHAPAPYNYISQRQSQHKAICDLYYIYSHTPREVVSQENIRLYCFKYVTKTVERIPIYLRRLYKKFSSFTNHYIHLRPDPVGYYIYTLERIVI